MIPARIGAVRLPRKPLRELGGLPLVLQVWRRVCRMGVADRVVVATDSEEIREVISGAGGEAILTSPACSSGTERVGAIAALPDFDGFDAFLNIQGDEPFISGAFVRAACGMVTSGAFPLGTAAAPAADEVLETPSVVKVVTRTDGGALYFSRAPIPYLRDPDDAPARVPLVLRHIGVYAYRRDALAHWIALPCHPLEEVERLEQLRPLANGMQIGVAVVDAPAHSGIDTEDDLHRANERWDAFMAEEQQC